MSKHDATNDVKGEDACRSCGGSGLTVVIAQDAYGPPAQHVRVCHCRFRARKRRA